MSSDSESLTQDLIFDVLSSARRRYVLYYLRNHQGRIEVTALAAKVAAWENDIPEEELSSQQQKRVYVSLYQTHIPKLAELGLVSYDQDRGVVELTERVGDIETFFSADGEERRPWQTYYLALAAASAVLLALTVLDVGFFSAVPDAVSGLVVVVAFGLLAAAHYVSERRGRRQFPTGIEERN